MTELGESSALLLGVVGGIVVIGLAARTALDRIGLPASAAFVLIGIALAGAEAAAGGAPDRLGEGLHFLGQIGLVALLFKVGLESDLDLLAAQLRNAAKIWLPGIAVPALLVFGVVWSWPGYGLLPAIFAGVAASATSVGVSTAVWEEAGRLRTPEGALLVDVAELDDLSTVVLMTLVFAIAPVLMGAGGDGLWRPALAALAGQVAKFALFCAACYVFSRYLEAHVTAWFGRRDARVGPLLFATGSAFLIAAAADWLGFSLAIGALFAGLAFSRDPAERRIDRSFAEIFALFSPFFFVAIGFAVEIAALGQGVLLAIPLLLAAVLGKLLGAGVPAALLTTRRTGLLIGLSMVPRAEIFLIVMLHGLALGSEVVPVELYCAAVLVSLVTCIAAPAAVGALLPRTRPSGVKG